MQRFSSGRPFSCLGCCPKGAPRHKKDTQTEGGRGDAGAPPQSPVAYPQSARLVALSGHEVADVPMPVARRGLPGAGPRAPHAAEPAELGLNPEARALRAPRGLGCAITGTRCGTGHAHNTVPGTGMGGGGGNRGTVDMWGPCGVRACARSGGVLSRPGPSHGRGPRSCGNKAPHMPPPPCDKSCGLCWTALGSGEKVCVGEGPSEPHFQTPPPLALRAQTSGSPKGSGRGSERGVRGYPHVHYLKMTRCAF